MRCDLQRLQNQTEPALKAGRVTDDDDGIWMPEADIVACDLFLGGFCIE